LKREGLHILSDVSLFQGIILLNTFGHERSRI
jgi:hypothetical protein